MTEATLFKRKDIYYARFSRTKKRSLGTSDEREAKAIVREMNKELLHDKLFELEKISRISLREFTNEYIKYRSGNVSPETLKKDALSLKLLAEVLTPSILIQSLDKKKIEEFKHVWHAKNASKITINGYLRHIKAALSYALEEGMITKKPKIKMYKEGDMLPRVLSIEDIDVIFSKVKETDIDLWRYLIFELWTGARRREGLNLTWQNCDLKKGIAKIKGKGDKERIVPLMKSVITALKPIKKDVGKVFVQYHPDTISKKFHKLAASCGIDARLHDLRHSAATYMLKNGIDIRIVQVILGHAQISTTMIYTHVLDEIMQKEMRKLKFK